MAINKDNFYTIQGFMVLPENAGGLGLKGNELLVYAVIYGFSQDGDTWFQGSQTYLAEMCGCTRQGVQKNLDSLIKKELIEKRNITNHGVTFVEYRCQTANTVCRPSKQSLHNTKEDNIPPLDISSNEEKTIPPQGEVGTDKKGRKGFVPPTEEEVDAYCASRGNGITGKAFVSYYEMSGWRLKNGQPMKNWKAAISYWESRNKEKEDKEKSSQQDLEFWN